ncbi:hypothetical protein CEE37_10510 [candidate division LCP-89 bacterium B3_LCP]|uniref:4Fe-4S ferredoxin-type domain-containing protein n=1 Tax=candidate division LCP-89 bacterium B3_LCP TaxID=2012998 RepID=A0A532UXS9_UNCL8|nr:MAG: hypothetical protein CEE37_10510 [candidate division LCP-89 bacterium B3_LCP]
MSTSEPNFHFVCTIAEAREIVDGHDLYWVSNCECREERGSCKRSGIFLCLQFKEKTAATGTGLRPVSKDEVLKILKESEETHLVPRPFRDNDIKTVTEGICFCCDCCCDFFTDDVPSPCDKGVYIERTDEELCTHCGECEEFCFFKAREWDGEELTVVADECYGCGVCVDVCPEGAIDMVGR